MSALNLEAATWRKSSYSGTGGDCVEVADDAPGVIPVRDSKDREGPCLIIGTRAWGAFIEFLRD
ncbi:DUF397 domain-containing protein [Streptomyces chattanoogensis]|uniref:DUF397 domain-containing protein n=1 Tax=Streptomyces chattanoogensis TaxID=66876 RepID=UPI003694181D